MNEKPASPPLATGGVGIGAGVASVIGVGLFVTSLANSKVLGLLPLQFVLKNQLGLGPEALAWFTTLALAPWYGKPLAGLLTDAWPIFGTRRRHYLMLAGLVGAALWLGLAFVPRTYVGLLAAAVAINVAVVVASTVTGAILVEVSQRHHATGRLSGLRNAVDFAAVIVAGPLSGFLATRALGVTAATGAILMLALVPAALAYREPARAPAEPRRLARELRALFSSRAMWGTAAVTLLVTVTPGFQTPLFYVQTGQLGFSGQLIGNLGLVGGIAAMVASLAYLPLCRRVPLRGLLYAGIAAGAAGVLPFLFYRSPASAVAITAAAGFLGTLAILPLFDLAARAAPAGLEGLGYAVVAFVMNLGIGASDVLGAWLYARFGLTFRELVAVNAGTTLLALAVVPLLPRALVAAREQEPA